MTSSLKLFSLYFNSLFYKTNRFQVAVRLLANDFGRFFTQKIDDILSKLDRIDSSSNQPDYVQENSYAGTPFTNFRPISSKRIKKLALNARCFQNFNFWVGASPAIGGQSSSETIIMMETARAYFLHVKKKPVFLFYIGKVSQGQILE